MSPRSVLTAYVEGPVARGNAGKRQGLYAAYQRAADHYARVALGSTAASKSETAPPATGIQAQDKSVKSPGKPGNPYAWRHVADAYTNLADLAAEDGDKTARDNYLQQAEDAHVSHASGCDTAHSHQAYASFLVTHRGNEREAVTVLEAAAPRHPELWRDCAAYCRRLGQTRRHEKAYNAYISSVPIGENGEPLTGIALARFRNRARTEYGRSLTAMLEFSEAAIQLESADAGHAEVIESLQTAAIAAREARDDGLVEQLERETAQVARDKIGTLTDLLHLHQLHLADTRRQRQAAALDPIAGVAHRIDMARAAVPRAPEPSQAPATEQVYRTVEQPAVRDDSVGQVGRRLRRQAPAPPGAAPDAAADTTGGQSASGERQRRRLVAGTAAAQQDRRAEVLTRPGDKAGTRDRPDALDQQVVTPARRDVADPADADGPGVGQQQLGGR